MTQPRSSVPWLALLLLLAVLGPSARAGDLFVACGGFRDTGVQEFDSTTGAYVGLFVPGGGNGPQPGTLAFGPNGDLFLTDQSTSSVLEYNGRTGAFVRTFVPSGSGGLNSPADLQFGPNGDLFVSDHFKVLEYNGTTGAFVRTFVPSSITGPQPVTLAFGPNGDLFVTDQLNTAVQEYNGKTGAFVRTFVPSGSGGLMNANGVAFGPNGDLFVSTKSNTFPPDNAAVLEYNGKTGAFDKTFVPFLSGGLISPQDMVFGPNGDLFVTDVLLGAVLEYNGTTGAFVHAFFTGLGSLPTDVTFGPAVPEPSSWLLMGCGLLAGLGLAARRPGRPAPTNKDE